MRKLTESTLVSLDGVIDSPERWAWANAPETEKVESASRPADRLRPAMRADNGTAPTSDSPMFAP